MNATLSAPAPAQLDARGYRRAHAGKLMIIERAGGTERSARDFFHIEDVGTHPTGLLVTGIFDNNRRGHMLATSVREANEAEIAWIGAHTESPQQSSS
jgi:hypothetical protein